jgi:hypothetical protein
MVTGPPITPVLANPLLLAVAAPVFRTTAPAGFPKRTCVTPSHLAESVIQLDSAVGGTTADGSRIPCAAGHVLPGLRRSASHTAICSAALTASCG